MSEKPNPESKDRFSFSFWIRTPKWLQKQAKEADTKAGWTIKKGGEVTSDSHELIDGWWVLKEKPDGK